MYKRYGQSCWGEILKGFLPGIAPPGVSHHAASGFAAQRRVLIIFALGQDRLTPRLGLGKNVARLRIRAQITNASIAPYGYKCYRKIHIVVQKLTSEIGAV